MLMVDGKSRFVSIYLFSFVSISCTSCGGAQCELKNGPKNRLGLGDDALFKEVLLATSMLEPDEMGFFYPKDVRPCFSRIRGKDCKIATFIKHLNAFCDLKRGAVLHKEERTGSSRFRYTNPLLQPYVLMRGLSERTISDDDLKETRDPKDPQKRFF
jgi:hypothetical protein